MIAEIAAIRAERPGVATVAASDPAEPAPFELALAALAFADVPGDRRFRPVARPASASPATGSSKVHAVEQATLLREALTIG